jgi:prevent-host-death family protein
MQKTISAFEARRQFGSVLDDVAGRGDHVIVERHGKPVAAVLPISFYERWNTRRERFFSMLEEIAERSDLSEEEAEQFAEEAVRWVRSQPK